MKGSYLIPTLIPEFSATKSRCVIEPILTQDIMHAGFCAYSKENVLLILVRK